MKQLHTDMTHFMLQLHRDMTHFMQLHTERGARLLVGSYTF